MTTTPTPPDLTGPLATAASLLATAALMDAATNAHISVTVSGDDINIQVPLYSGGESARTAVVTAYADVLSTPVRRRPGERHDWIETDGTIAGHPVHIWTIADQLAADPTGEDTTNRKEAHTTA